MAQLTWGVSGIPNYETGVDRGVLYLNRYLAVPWNGLVSVETNSEATEVAETYLDGTKRFSLITPTEFSATIEAFSFPAEFATCIGHKQVIPGMNLTQQLRSRFSLSYRTMTKQNNYNIHIVYNAMLSLSPVQHKTIADKTNPNIYKWSITAVPLPDMLYESYRPTPHIVINTSTMDPDWVTRIENILYGDSELPPYLLYPEDIAVLRDLGA